MNKAQRNRTDYTLLRLRMRKMDYTQRSISEAIDMNESHLCRKLAGRFDFTQEDIRRICRLLDIAPSEIGRYFFAPEYEKSQLAARRAAAPAGRPITPAS